MTTQSQSDKAEVWLARHGIVAATPGGSLQEPPPPLSSSDEGTDDDWASDAQRWYLQRAEGVDVAQLLPYHQTAGK